MASPRERAAWMATSRFSLIFFWPMNSARRCGRSFSSKEESSSTGAAETSRSRLSVGLGLLRAVPIFADSNSWRDDCQSEDEAARQFYNSHLKAACGETAQQEEGTPKTARTQRDPASR